MPVVGGCQIFPANNWWNTDISGYPLDPNSQQYIARFRATCIPTSAQIRTTAFRSTSCRSTQKKVPVHFRYGSQSDTGPYPIPPNAQIEGGRHASGDRHVLVLQQGVCKLYEMWDAYPIHGGKSWRAGSGALFHLNSNKLRPNGWTSADAAGLPILPALVKCDGGAGGRDRSRAARDLQRNAARLHPSRDALRERQPRRRTCRRWDCVCG